MKYALLINYSLSIGIDNMKIKFTVILSLVLHVIFLSAGVLNQFLYKFVFVSNFMTFLSWRNEVV